MLKNTLPFLLFLGIAAPLSAGAQGSLVRFEGGIGSQPFARNAAGALINNDVQNVLPGGRPWVISRLSVDVKTDGRISVDGRGLLLGGGNNVGRTGGQSVRARLFCGGVAHDTDPLVALEPNGDFRIDDTLKDLPNPCADAILLIVSGGGNWFAAGIPKQ
jgi:hypothetical protein